MSPIFNKSRRSGKDRRSGKERRLYIASSGTYDDRAERRVSSDRRMGMDRRKLDLHVPEL